MVDGAVTVTPRSTCMNEASSGACGMEQGQAEAV